MCSGRVDLAFLLRAFAKGVDGVFIGGCRLKECNYITHGNFHALSTVLLFRKIMVRIGLNPERLRIQFLSSGEGILLTEVINDFCRSIRGIGPLGKSEGLAPETLALKLAALTQMVPYLKLVERERLRLPILLPEEEYHRFYASAEVERLFEELVVDKLAVSEIMLLLRESPLSTGEIARRLGLNPSEVSRHLASSSRHGLVRYDAGCKRFALA
jgi:coenzyme F420-reducing hydrogenase delta subunit/DNA-binding transcriptional ArsR family regulator